MKGLGIVVPAYNEEEVIEEFVEKVELIIGDTDGWDFVIVDDGSKDKTAEILRNLQTRYSNMVVLTHETNKGLGMALNTGLSYASKNYLSVLTMDADLTHPPELIGLMMVKIFEEGKDVCIASRYIDGGGMKDVPGYRVVISKFANFIFRTFYGIKAKDVTAGYKAYSSDVIKDLVIERPGFVVQLEIMVKLAKKACTFSEIPLVLVNRTKGSSKFNFFKMVPKYAVQATELFFERWFG